MEVLKHPEIAKCGALDFLCDVAFVYEDGGAERTGTMHNSASILSDVVVRKDAR